MDSFSQFTDSTQKPPANYIFTFDHIFVTYKIKKRLYTFLWEWENYNFENSYRPEICYYLKCNSENQVLNNLGLHHHFIQLIDSVNNYINHHYFQAQLLTYHIY